MLATECISDVDAQNLLYRGRQVVDALKGLIMTASSAYGQNSAAAVVKPGASRVVNTITELLDAMVSASNSNTECTQRNCNSEGDQSIMINSETELSEAALSIEVQRSYLESLRKLPEAANFSKEFVSILSDVCSVAEATRSLVLAAADSRKSMQCSDIWGPNIDESTSSDAQNVASTVTVLAEAVSDVLKNGSESMNLVTSAASSVLASTLHLVSNSDNQDPNPTTKQNVRDASRLVSERIHSFVCTDNDDDSSDCRRNAFLSEDYLRMRMNVMSPIAEFNEIPLLPDVPTAVEEEFDLSPRPQRPSMISQPSTDEDLVSRLARLRGAR